MVNTAQRFIRSVSAFALVLAGSTFALTGAPVLAQPRGIVTVPQIPAGGAVSYRGPPPVVMFRATTPQPNLVAPIEFVDPPAPALAPPVTRQYSIVNQANRDAAQAGWDAASTEPVVAPPMVDGAIIGRGSAVLSTASQTDGRRYRGPMRRILEDTGKGIVHGIPEAVAEALPWVDRDATKEPFNDVLARAADDLNRATQGDPAWALPAQREIRALSRRLDSLSAPPRLAQSESNFRPANGLESVDERPFRPRPIWPGAAGRPETQVRPVTLTTTTGQQDGPTATGVAARYIPAAEDDDGNPPPRVAQTRARSGARGTPAPRRGAGSR